MGLFIFNKEIFKIRQFKVSKFIYSIEYLTLKWNLTASMELQAAATPEVKTSKKAPAWSVKRRRSQQEYAAKRGEEHRRD